MVLLQIPIDGGINSTESQWAPARSSLREHITQPVTVWDKTFTRWKGKDPDSQGFSLLDMKMSFLVRFYKI